MASEQSTNREVRDCLVCGASTSVAYMGIDVCRACAIFYRRSVNKAPRDCRNNNNKCSVRNGTKCKRCRFDIIEKILQLDKTTLQPADFSRKPIKGISDIDTLTQSTSTSAHVDRFLLEHLRLGYRSICHSRLMAEIYARGNVFHHTGISVDSHPTFPAKYHSFHRGNEILLPCALEFGSTVFPDFAAFSENEKWDVVVDFFYRFRALEGCYRANKKFPAHPDRFVSSVTLYISREALESFYDDVEDLVEKKAAMSKSNGHILRIGHVIAGRRMIQRFDPRDEEFLALVGLMFWSIGDDVQISDGIRGVAEEYRKQILSDLHSFYRDVLQLDNYAARLGELLMFVQVFDIKYEYREHFELLRLLNLINDDNCVYRMQKE